MELTKMIVTMALTFALTIALAEQSPLPSKRVSRFLQDKNPRAAGHCTNNEGICALEGGANSTCCSNQCVDLVADNNNCGTCKRKCKFREVCCRGECIDVAFDKRHCGACNHRCSPGASCVYGMCNYA